MRPARLLQHEVALSVLAFALWLGLVVRAGPLQPTTLTLLAVGIGQLAAARFLPGKLRLASAYVVALALFGLTRDVVPALRLPARDGALLAIDQKMFGQTPSVLLAPFAQPWLTELMSAFYLSYLVYFHVALGQALLLPIKAARRYFEPVYTALACGMAGYYLVPALGPIATVPAFTRHPLVAGPITAFNQAIVNRGSGVYDVFPSLHVLMTLVLLEHDRREHPLRFRIMLPIAVGLCFSTVYLRYHYAVDLLAGVSWFAALLAIRKRPHEE